MSEDIFKLYQEFTKNKYRNNSPNELINSNTSLTSNAPNSITSQTASKINYVNLNINDLKNSNKLESAIHSNINQSVPFKVLLPGSTNNYNFDLLSANDK
jgi:hypothetical protein